ncbi:hypothetical protein ENBRE01_2637 [Enteropsectra breve]|nr:hypothetical protein ENBRE01_2637 [Enteropsectra breve]
MRHKNLKKLAEFTGVSYSAISRCVRKIESSETSEPQYTDLFNKPGKKQQDKTALHTEIRNIIGNNNSLILIGVRERLSVNISASQVCQEFKAAGLKRKRKKKKEKI